MKERKTEQNKKRITVFKFSRAEFEAFEREYWKKYNKA
tara:strand:+ start:390 stop:503 length:114 start_codon:yes stop_codon:yes gene_type:complete